ncbi:MAG: FtsQ-type POTRA domain-containing protein [Simkaniaceae bacterium]|nr:FtsQ-type POTRA domain-containing protein [Simkaniaceae bacterium]
MAPFLFFGAKKVYLESQEEKKRDDRYLITAIIQTGLDQKALKTDYLASLLSLSKDHPTNLYAFDLEEGKEKLLACPVIKEASLKRKPPDTLYIDYTLRQPLAMLVDFENTAVDEEGRIFPFSPFFSPKKLPEVRFGLKEFSGWNPPLVGFPLILDIIPLLEHHGLRPLLIDVAQVEAPSLGKRQVIVQLENHLLRLTPDEYPQQLGNYLEFLSELKIQETETGATLKVIDLRLPKMAYVDDTEQMSWQPGGF